MGRRIAIVLTTRGNYAKMKSTMRAVVERDDLELITIVGGGIIQARFGDYRPVIERDGFKIDETVDFLEGDGATLDSQTLSAGRAVTMIGEALGRLLPDLVLVIADRWEALSVAFAATTMNIPIAHLEGGEVSGSIDERLRHAITKLAHQHLPANPEAARRLERMGEPTARIAIVGTPSLDLLSNIDLGDRSVLGEALYVQGDRIDFGSDYAVVSQHPVVTEEDQAEAQIIETARGAARAGLPIAWMLPNMDAGGAGVMMAVTRLVNGGLGVPVRFYASMEFSRYSVLLANARVLIGNSSSGIRECAFLGTPVVNIGTRQNGRDRGRNVVDVSYDRHAIADAVVRQVAHGPYRSDPLYGDGTSGSKIANALATMPLALDKAIFE